MAQNAKVKDSGLRICICIVPKERNCFCGICWGKVMPKEYVNIVKQWKINQFKAWWWCAHRLWDLASGTEFRSSPSSASFISSRMASASCPKRGVKDRQCIRRTCRNHPKSKQIIPFMFHHFSVGKLGTSIRRLEPSSWNFNHFCVVCRTWLIRRTLLQVWTVIKQGSLPSDLTIWLDNPIPTDVPSWQNQV